MIWLAAAGAPTVEAQPLGAFQWQLQPFCNTVTLNVTPVGGVFELSGVDNLCGAARQASVVGIAFLNADGTIGFGLTTVQPGGVAVHLDAAISLASLNGEWRDSAGNAGSFVFTPGAGSGGPVRPVPANGVPLGSISAAHLAPGVVGSLQINPTEVQTRVTGRCPIGQYLRGITSAGNVICEQLLTPPVTTTVDDLADDVGSSSSMTIGADGLPIVSHHNFTAKTLRVTRCGNTTCTAGNVSVTADNPAASVGTHTSIAIGGDGLPIIGHHDTTELALRVTKCGNPACNAGNISTTVDNPADIVGQFTSIAIATDGLPIISHWNASAGALRVTKCGNTVCSVATSIDIDNPDDVVGLSTSIAIAPDGLPVISHHNFTVDTLRVTKCGNASCSAGNTSATADDPAFGVGSGSALAIGSDGLPIISHLDHTGPFLRVTKCGNPTCASGNQSTTIAGAFASLDPTSIGINPVNQLPIVSFRSSAVLQVVQCMNVACGPGDPPNMTASIAGPLPPLGSHPSMAIGLDGLPVISHRTAAGDLRITKCSTHTCQ